MQFETISPAYFPPEVTEKSKLCCKIDWMTVVFKDCSMRDVLKWIELDSAIPDFMESITLQHRGLDQKYIFTYNSVRLEAPTLIFYGVKEDVSIFDLTIPSIRLDLSGTGLDYLRSIGVDVNALRYKVPQSACPGMSWHFTRCDFAFDFVNYSAGFVDELIAFVNSNRLPSDRVPLSGTNSAISVSVRTGGEKTVYLGSPQSDKLLRVYDKRMQYVDLATGVYRKDNPYDNPDSWFRIEWQTRNRFADGLVRSSDHDFIHILRQIFEHYAFADAKFDGKSGVRPPVDFWLKLLRWEDIKAIEVQNGDLVYFRTPEERLVLSCQRAAIPAAAFICKFGLNEYLKLISDVVNTLDISDPSDQRRNEAYLAKFNEYGVDVHVSKEGVLVNGANQINGKLFLCFDL